MALTPAEKQAAYRKRQAEKLKQDMDALRQQAAQPANPGLSKSAKERYDRALAKATAQLKADFDRSVREAADAMIPDRVAMYEELQAKADAAQMRFYAMSSGISAHITQEDYRVLRSFFHSDKAPSDEQKNKAFNIVQKIGEYVKAIN